MIAYSYPLLGIFWTMMMFFLWVAWLTALFSVIGDIFRSDDLGGGAKAAWTAAVIIVPIIGLMIYLLSRGDGMHGRQVAAARAQEADFQAYVRDVSSSSGAADELTKLSELHTSGIITADEFHSQKAKILA